MNHILHWNDQRVKSVTLYIPQRFEKVFKPRLSHLSGELAKEELFRIARDYQKTEPELSYNAYAFANALSPTIDKIKVIFFTDEDGR